MSEHASEYDCGYRFDTSQVSPRFDFLYPRSHPTLVDVVIGLEDVRAANPIHVRYDFDRDGWVIESSTIFMWDADDEVLERGMEEVAFVPAFSEKAATELDRVIGR